MLPGEFPSPVRAVTSRAVRDCRRGMENPSAREATHGPARACGGGGGPLNLPFFEVAEHQAVLDQRFVARLGVADCVL